MGLRNAGLSELSVDSTVVSTPAVQAPVRKIVHVVLSLEPGGLERLVCDLSAATAAARMEVVVCCLDTLGELAPTLQSQGIRVDLVTRQGGLDLGLIPKLVRYFREQQATVVHTHGPDPMFYGAWAALIAGVPTRVHTLHDTMLQNAGWRARVKFRLAIPALNFLVAVTKKAEEHVAATYGRSRRLLTILNGIDEHRFVPSAAAAPHGSTACVVGTVARLAPEKGLDRLVEAFGQLARRHDSMRLVIAGGGREAQSLTEQAHRLGLADRVSFPGHQSRPESVLVTLDIFVLPSLTEGIPLALLEAMAVGLPVVATSVGGVPDVVEDGISGILVPPDDPAALARAIDGLASDPVRRQRLGRAGRERVARRFSLSAMAAAYRELYRRDAAERWWVGPVRAAIRRSLPRTAVLWSGVRNRPEVAITFDDGPDPYYTPRLLEILAKYDARGTFFLIGTSVLKYPDLVKQIVEAGHEIGSHSHSHADFTKVSFKTAAQEIESAREALAPFTPPSARRLFRPPFGRFCAASTIVPWFRGETVVMWNHDFKDYMAEEATDITAKLDRRGVEAGDIIVYHGHNAAAVEALPAILESGRATKVSFVPISRLLES
jgi:sugar transferase (PEP-CTERM/EpsH1 system associated)